MGKSTTRRRNSDDLVRREPHRGVPRLVARKSFAKMLLAHDPPLFMLCVENAFRPSGGSGQITLAERTSRAGHTIGSLEVCVDGGEAARFRVRLVAGSRSGMACA